MAFYPIFLVTTREFKVFCSLPGILTMVESNNVSTSCRSVFTREALLELSSISTR